MVGSSVDWMAVMTAESKAQRMVECWVDTMVDWMAVTKAESKAASKAAMTAAH